MSSSPPSRTRVRTGFPSTRKPACTWIAPCTTFGTTELRPASSSTRPPRSMLSEVLDLVDYVLVMSVNPGFGAQTFLPNSLHKMRRLAEARARRGLNFRIEVDGGVALDTVAEVVRAGAEILVAGNAVFGKGDPKENAEKLLKAATEATLLKV